jgi:hypothetical protein
MLFTTTTQFAALALTLLAGWFLGLASSSGGRRWRERYVAERDAHAVTRRDAETRVAEADRRRAEIERDHARLSTAAPAAPVRAAAPVSSVRPYNRTYPNGEKRGWFDWGPRTAR